MTKKTNLADELASKQTRLNDKIATKLLINFLSKGYTFVCNLDFQTGDGYKPEDLSMHIRSFREHDLFTSWVIRLLGLDKLIAGGRVYANLEFKLNKDGDLEAYEHGAYYEAFCELQDNDPEDYQESDEIHRVIDEQRRRQRFLYHRLVRLFRRTSFVGLQVYTN